MEEFLKYESECELFVDELESHISSVEELVSSSKLDRIVSSFIVLTILGSRNCSCEDQLGERHGLNY